MKVIKIYTDGGYRVKYNIGAISYIIVHNNKILSEFSKTYKNKEDGYITINRMEMLAVIKSINKLKSNGHSKNSIVYVYTDSQYVQLGISKWMEKRKTNSKNKNMWINLDNLIKHAIDAFESIYINWIPSNSEDKFHKRAHELCTISMDKYLGNEIKVQTN